MSKQITDDVCIGIMQGIVDTIRKGDKQAGDTRVFECDWARFKFLADRLEELDTPLALLSGYLRLDKFDFKQVLPDYALRDHLKWPQYQPQRPSIRNVHFLQIDVSITYSEIKFDINYDFNKFKLRATV